MTGTQLNSDLVFYKRGDQQYARARVKPANPNTADQQATRAQISAVTKRWATVSAADRQAWNEWAELNIDNKGTNPSGNLAKGLNAYLKANMMRGLMGLAYVDTAPVNTIPAPPTLLNETLGIDATAHTTTAGYINHTYVAGELADYSVLVKVSDVTSSPARKPQATQVRMIEGALAGSFQPLAASGTPYTFAACRFQASYEAHLADAVAPVGVSFQIIENASGIASVEFFVPATLTE
jgi:hypothetical protein